MALPTLSTTINSYPNGTVRQQNNDVYKGSVAIGSGGLYQTNGLPWNPVTTAVSGSNIQALSATVPSWVEMYSPSTGFVYRYDPTHQTIRIFVTGTAANDPMNELANAGSVTADTVYFRMEIQPN